MTLVPGIFGRGGKGGKSGKGIPDTPVPTTGNLLKTDSLPGYWSGIFLNVPLEMAISSLAAGTESSTPIKELK